MPEISNDNRVSSVWDRPFTPPESCPQQADVVIIGAGIVGISTAWFLARQGVNVVVCEKGHVAGEQSSRNWGWVRCQGRDEREIPMMLESLRIWDSLAVDIGEDVGFTRSGCLYLTDNEKLLADYTDWLDVARKYGMDTRIIDGQELDRHVSGASSRWLGAMFTAGDGRAEPDKATPAIARAAERSGATVLTSCAVRGIETQAGRVSAAVTEHGTIRTSTVLCAAGAWTSMFCRSLGISFPQLQVRGTVARTAAAKVILEGNVFDDRIGIRRRQDGGYTVADGIILDHFITPTTFRYSFKFLPALMQKLKSLRISIGRPFLDELMTPSKWPLDEESPFERTRVLDPPVNRRVLKRISRKMDEIFPELAGTEIVESWAGMVETTPDVVPVMCEADTIPGFYMASGLSGHGFGIGPGAGKALAALVTGGESGLDMTPFRLSRFFDGTPLQLDSLM
ncbi:MAG: FAD-binding oxidoreductase [Woeseiaceae bacterium]|nr:FAD-binding oxidoreductase [Woeseiaceae bacterium]